MNFNFTAIILNTVTIIAEKNLEKILFFIIFFVNEIPILVKNPMKKDINISIRFPPKNKVKAAAITA